ncbi:Eap1p KNAG_0B00230 [Huiozyma naganishii CBS 8797]|uniref:Uncharacterized protein n=1 Tax=Huiozyma naganishii (strain ATCC MYA-139 / BCRC 22969 / CBS 8797 / KCTC 17520 / NBRC 10181 / NCYC 3082 / Yp74L-3) TaxID=1071383 RepID=J7RUI6_HUIN7|nr:hypothetical protein KNAG_0B00230 [Kazachstania naganishii CBS 8797]CCK68472.1 hypothetical protein KNAG_0B00230 [Kazachstania naganishii CBS 8797]
MDTSEPQVATIAEDATRDPKAKKLSSVTALQNRLPFDDLDDISNLKSTSSGKPHVYSICELITMYQDVSGELFIAKEAILPNRKFWRLHQRFLDNGPNNKNANRFDRRNSKNRNNANTGNAKKQGFAHKLDGEGRQQHNKKNAGLDVDVLEFDDNFVPSGNAMKDFETWKAKMREIEQQKKTNGKPAKGRPVPNTAATAVIAKNMGPQTGTTSVMSDFFNLSGTTTSSEKALSMTELEGSVVKTGGTVPESAQESASTQVTVPKNALETSRSSSSRFSSFFASPSNISATTMNTDKKETASPNNNTNTATNMSTAITAKIDGDSANVEQPKQQSVSGSRLMNFFKNSSQSTTPTNNSPAATAASLPNILKGPPPPGLARSTNVESRGNNDNNKHNHQMENIHAPPMMPGGPVQFGPIPQQMPMPQNTNAFFQGLLNKNKMADLPPTDGNNKKGNNLPMQASQHMPPPPPGLMQQPGMMNGGAPPNFGMMPPHPPHPMGSMPPGMQNFMNQPKFDKSGKLVKQENTNPNKDMNSQPPFMSMPMPPPPGFMMMPPNMHFPPPNNMMPPPHLQQVGAADGNVTNVKNGTNTANENQGRFVPPMPMNPNMMGPMRPNMNVPPQGNINIHADKR